MYTHTHTHSVSPLKTQSLIANIASLAKYASNQRSNMIISVLLGIKVGEAKSRDQGTY